MGGWREVAMARVLSEPDPGAHVSACGLFCTNCGKFKAGKCKGCQVAPAFECCPVRTCCEQRIITTCAQCTDFAAPRSYRECPKVNSFIARVISFFTRSDRPAALALLRDMGLEGYLAEKRASGRM
jgi:hypothetical protein